MNGKACSNCQFWREPINRSLRAPGECRATPAFYPKLSNDWCGQHEPKVSLKPNVDAMLARSPEYGRICDPSIWSQLDG